MENKNYEKNNLSLLMDFYELSMGHGFFKKGFSDKIAYFDLFFRKIPDNGGYAIVAGLKQFIEYIKSFKFDGDDISFLRSTGKFCEDFLRYLEHFKFSCDIWAIPEGTPIFPGEPIITVRGSIIEAQLIETMSLIIFNHQSLIATKASRIVRAAGGREVIEFGSRRAHGESAAIYGARAAYIGGVTATSCVLAERKFGVPSTGTMAHSWVQMFDSELEAFRAYADIYPDNCVLLVDTYNTLKSGIPNAITAFNELAGRGYRPRGIRIDSGDITYLSKKARKMLDEAGFPECDIIASNSLDETIIRDMLLQGAVVDVFAVGERLITASSDPVFGGVYKLVAVEENDGTIIPKIKLSDNISKITIPCFKQCWRLFDYETGKAIADVITMNDETIDGNSEYELFDPDHIWKRKTVNKFIARKLQIPVFEKGICVYESPDVSDIREYSLNQISTLWDEVRRSHNPHKYYVDLSQKLWDARQNMLHSSF